MYLLKTQYFSKNKKIIYIQYRDAEMKLLAFTTIDKIDEIIKKYHLEKYSNTIHNFIKNGEIGQIFKIT